MGRFKLTDKPAAAGRRAVHALCGGGEATDGLYFADITWCGVEKHSKVYLAPTDRPVTCKRCKAALAKRRKQND